MAYSGFIYVRSVVKYSGFIGGQVYYINKGEVLEDYKDLIAVDERLVNKLRTILRRLNH